MYDSDDVVQMARKGPIKARSLGQLSGTVSIASIVDRLSDAGEHLGEGEANPIEEGASR